MDLLSGLGFMSALQSVPTQDPPECLAPHGSGFHEPRPAGRLPAPQDWPELLLQCACALEGKTHYREVKRANKLVRRIVYLPPAFMQVVQGPQPKGRIREEEGGALCGGATKFFCALVLPSNGGSCSTVLLSLAGQELLHRHCAFSVSVPLGPTGLRPSSVAARSIFYVYDINACPRGPKVFTCPRKRVTLFTTSSVVAALRSSTLCAGVDDRDSALTR